MINRTIPLFLLLSGCYPTETITIKCQSHRVIAVGKCYESWSSGCNVCGVVYENHEGGRECDPMVGANYKVCKEVTQ